MRDPSVGALFFAIIFSIACTPLQYLCIILKLLLNSWKTLPRHFWVTGSKRKYNNKLFQENKLLFHQLVRDNAKVSTPCSSATLHVRNQQPTRETQKGSPCNGVQQRFLVNFVGTIRLMNEKLIVHEFAMRHSDGLSIRRGPYGLLFFKEEEEEEGEFGNQVALVGVSSSARSSGCQPRTMPGSRRKRANMDYYDHNYYDDYYSYYYNNNYYYKKRLQLQLSRSIPSKAPRR